MKRRHLFFASFVLLFTLGPPSLLAQNRVGIRCVSEMPDIPSPFLMRDWRGVTDGYTRLVFDEKATGQYLPLIGFTRNATGKIVDWGLPPYVGQNEHTKAGKPTHVYDGITTLGAVWSGTQIGINFSGGPFDFVVNCDEFFDSKTGIAGNTIRHADPEKTFWYSLLPSIVAISIADHYPTELTKESLRCTRAWATMVEALKDREGLANFDHTGFDFATMKPTDNGSWKEPDSAAGVAWIEYMGYQRWHDPKMLAAARDSLLFLDRRPANENPMYEIILPFGALVAARANAELGDHHDLNKIINWAFDRSAARPDWKVNTERWDGYDVAGLGGGINNPPGRPWLGGYAFTMNTFVMAWPIVPVARYDPRYAHDIGKWMLNVANAARLFYANGLPPGHQSCPDWKGDPNHTIAYEGLKFRWDDPKQELLATGDPIHEHWGPKTDFGLYGSSYVGVFGSIISRTEDPQILKLDLLATDDLHPKAYPSYLVYNPHQVHKTISLISGTGKYSVYNAVTGAFMARNVTSAYGITLEADQAIVAVIVPADGKLTYSHGKTLVNGVVIDYRR